MLTLTIQGLPSCEQPLRHQWDTHRGITQGGGTNGGLTWGDRGDLDRRVLMLRLESIRLMGFVITTRGSAFCVCVTIGLVVTTSMPTSVGSDDVIKWRQGPAPRALAEGTRLPWNVSLAARDGAAACGLPAGFAQGFCRVQKYTLSSGVAPKHHD